LFGPESSHILSQISVPVSSHGITHPEAKESYAKRAEFMKRSLEVFNLLVTNYNFDPLELWQ
jgi:hypothetical protein